MIQPVSRSTYVPHIDGLRAVAVLAVIVYHLNATWLPGGFAGVDVFFVISGFVVSASLAEFKKSTPQAFFAYFYARRILRIVPALVTCLLVTHLVSMLFIPYAWLSNTNERTGLYAFFGLSNFILAQNGNDYFSPRAEFNPYTHTWSLGVEEQFYLIFPPLFAAWIAGGHWRRFSSGLFALGLIASLACAAWLAHSTRDVSFYMLYTRFWELAGGVLLYQLLVYTGHAFAEHDRPVTRWSSAGAFASIGVIAEGFVLSRPGSFPYPGALLPVVGTLGLLAFLHGREPRGFVMHVLRLPLVVFIGQISYSLYLWHWPVYVLFRWTIGLESTLARIAAVVLTFALSIASYFWIERPVRRAKRLRQMPRFAVIAAGAVLIASSALLASQITAHAPQFSLTQEARNMPDWYPGRLDGIGKRNCTLAARTEDIGGGNMISFWSGANCAHPAHAMPRLFAIGDSHAEAYSTMLMMFALDTGADVRKYANGGCPVLSLQLDREAGWCKPFTQASLPDILGKIKSGDILFLPSLRLDRLTDQNVHRNEAAAWENAVGAGATEKRRRAIEEAVAVLKPFADRGVRIVFDAPKPIFRAPPFRCVDWFNVDNPICAPGLTMQRADLLRYREPVMQALNEIASRVGGVTIWDSFPFLCPGETCRATDNGHPLFYDGDHLSGYGNRMLLPHFEAFIGDLIGQPDLAGAH